MNWRDSDNVAATENHQRLLEPNFIRAFFQRGAAQRWVVFSFILLFLEIVVGVIGVALGLGLFLYISQPDLILNLLGLILGLGVVGLITGFILVLGFMQTRNPETGQKRESLSPFWQRMPVYLALGGAAAGLIIHLMTMVVPIIISMESLPWWAAMAAFFGIVLANVLLLIYIMRMDN